MAAVMMPFADTLSAQDARDVGAYFATQKAGAGVADDTVIATGPNAGKKFFEVGQQLFRGGDAARGIPACMACHGPDGAGNPGPAYPHVAGQQSAYTKRRLEEYRAGTTDAARPAPFQIMADDRQAADRRGNRLAGELPAGPASERRRRRWRRATAAAPRLRPLPHRPPPHRPRRRPTRPAAEPPAESGSHPLRRTAALGRSDEAQ